MKKRIRKKLMVGEFAAETDPLRHTYRNSYDEERERLQRLYDALQEAKEQGREEEFYKEHDLEWAKDYLRDKMIRYGII